jgi:hypothetical protein
MNGVKIIMYDSRYCYVEGSVDVVNHKWLVHTPTAYIDWVEKAPWSNVDGYYSGGSISGSDFKRVRSFTTENYDVSDVELGRTYGLVKISHESHNWWRRKSWHWPS